MQKVSVSDIKMHCKKLKLYKWIKLKNFISKFNFKNIILIISQLNTIWNDIKLEIFLFTVCIIIHKHKTCLLFRKYSCFVRERSPISIKQRFTSAVLVERWEGVVEDNLRFKQLSFNFKNSNKVNFHLNLATNFHSHLINQ